MASNTPSVLREYRVQFLGITGELFWHREVLFSSIADAQAYGRRRAMPPGFRVVNERDECVAEERTPPYADLIAFGPETPWSR